MRGSVRGCVVRADNGDPVGGATIMVLRGPGPVPDIAPLTDSGGCFALDRLPAGKWVLSATSSAGGAAATVYVFDNAASDVTIEINELPHAPKRHAAGGPAIKTRRSMYGDVRGCVVRTDNGEPVGDATITLVRGPGPAPDIAPLTDSAGWFALHGLPEGEWVLSATSSAVRGEAVVHVFGNATSDVTINVAGQSRAARPGAAGGPPNKKERNMYGGVRGRVLRADNGEPIADATIMVRGPGAAPDIAPLTDSAGRFALDGLPEGEWVLRALGPGGERGEARVRVSAGSVADTTIIIEATGLEGAGH